MASDDDPGPTYVPIVGSHLARTPEDLAEAFAGFPERIVALRQQNASGSLTASEQEELRCIEDILNRSAPWLLPAG